VRGGGGSAAAGGGGVGGGLGDALVAAVLAGTGQLDHGFGVGGVGAAGRGEAGLPAAEADIGGGGGEHGGSHGQPPSAAPPSLGKGVPGGDVVRLGGRAGRLPVWLRDRRGGCRGGRDRVRVGERPDRAGRARRRWR